MIFSLVLTPVFSGNGHIDTYLCKMASGDINALHNIYKETKDAIYIYALRKLGNRAMAEDAMQETYLRVAGACASYTAGTNARAWIYGICRNICRDMLKGPQTSDIDELEDLSASTDFANRFIEKEDIRNALSRLEADEREIVELHIFSDFKLTDIADFLHLSYNSVRSKYTYAIKKLKNELGSSYRKGGNANE